MGKIHWAWFLIGQDLNWNTQIGQEVKAELSCPPLFCDYICIHFNSEKGSKKVFMIHACDHTHARV